MIDIPLTYIYALSFFGIALVYSSAGFGGGSLYLAALAQSSTPVVIVRAMALVCNGLVTGTGTANFNAHKHLPWKRAFTLIVFSVPPCIAATFIRLPETVFYFALGCCLVVAAGAMLLTGRAKEKWTGEARTSMWLFPLSAVIGFIAGLTGIGGGVYLAPLLYFFRWGNEKQIAATCSLFILVNSLSSLSVLAGTGQIAWESFMIGPIIAVVAGGFIGSRLSASVFSMRAVRFITTGLLIFAGIRLILR